MIKCGSNLTTNEVGNVADTFAHISSNASEYIHLIAKANGEITSSTKSTNAYIFTVPNQFEKSEFYSLSITSYIQKKIII